MSELLLKIRNNHSASCGEPPGIDTESTDCYVGYFENHYGEQWIFTHDYKTKVTTLRGGDIGWDSSVDVIDGIAKDLILNDEERQWLQACCRGASVQQ